MLLDHERIAAALDLSAARLGRDVEFALLAILLECHNDPLPRFRPSHAVLVSLVTLTVVREAGADIAKNAARDTKVPSDNAHIKHLNGCAPAQCADGTVKPDLRFVCFLV